nr:OB-fold-containig protein [Armatimonas sp.]
MALGEPEGILQPWVYDAVQKLRRTATLAEPSSNLSRQPHSWHYYAPAIAVATIITLIFILVRNNIGTMGSNSPEGGPQNMADLLKWQWVVFLVPLALAVLLALATAVSVGGDHGESEGGHDHDLDGDQDHDAADHEAEAGGHSSPLSVLGVGQAPLSVILICLLVYWAVIGSLGNLALGVHSIGLTIGLALVGSLLATSGTARLVGRFLPTSQSFSVKRHELIGREGTAIHPITESSGTVRLYDSLGTLRQLDSRTMPGGAVIPQDTKVIVIDYDRARQVFTVQKWDDLVRIKED